MDHRDLLETKGSRERQEIRVIQVNRDPLVCQEKLECKALKDHLEWVVMTDYRESKESQVTLDTLARLESKESVVQLGTPVRLAQLDSLVTKVLLGALATVGPMGHRAPLDHQEPMAILDLRE